MRPYAASVLGLKLRAHGVRILTQKALLGAYAEGVSLDTLARYVTAEQVIRLLTHADVS
jgi:hypothetical protein